MKDFRQVSTLDKIFFLKNPLGKYKRYDFFDHLWKHTEYIEWELVIK